MSAMHSPGPFYQEATCSCDFRSIRYINDDSGRVIAEVRYADGAEQAEDLANSALFSASAELLQVAEWAEAALSYLSIKATTQADRDEFKRRFALTQAAIWKAKGLKS